MKMVKSLLLGSAAGLVAVAGAQAADLPVKAKPVEYVKICSLYGEGFFYIPGTDTCIKIGGWVRAEYVTGAAGSFSTFTAGGGGRNDRISTKDFNMRARTVMSFDVRTQTEYGTVRAYYRNGFELTTDAMGGGQGTYYTERAFIQFAGFTLGKSQSYFDFYNGVFGYGLSYLGGGGSNTGASGTILAAYTAQFGSGFSASLSVEDNTYRRNAIWDAGTNSLALGAFPGPNGWTPVGYATCGVAITGNDVAVAAPAGAIGAQNVVGCTTGDYAAQQIPDIIGSLRVDQAWGSAQIAGALHQLRAGYYGNNFLPAALPTGPAGWTGVAPDDKWGWAVMAGVVVNLPWNAGDKFWVEGTYTQGAVQYMGQAQTGTFGTFARFSGNTVGQGQGLDAIFANTGTSAAGTPGAPSGLQLTTAWTVGAAIEHYWTPALRSDLFGSYMETSYNGTATAIYCSSPVNNIRTNTGLTPAAAGVAFNQVAGLAGCNPDYKVWGIGLRTIWNPVKNLDIGLEVMYSKLDQNMNPATTAWNFGGAGGRPAGLYVPSDQDNWSGGIRVQRNFWP